jgi:hypothetical protein
MNGQQVKTLSPILLALLLGLGGGTLLQTPPPLGSRDNTSVDQWQLPAVPESQIDLEADRRLAIRNPWGADNGVSDSDVNTAKEDEHEAREAARRRTTWRFVGLSRVESEPQPRVFFVNEAGDWQRLAPGDSLPGGWVLTDAHGGDSATLRGPNGEQRELRLYQPQRLQAEMPRTNNKETPDKPDARDNTETDAAT